MRTNYPKHLEAFSYVGVHQYSLTFCTHDRREVFTADEDVAAPTAQILRAADDERFAIVAYCFMPDHLHLVVEGVAEYSDLKGFISRAKQFSGYEHSQRTGKRLWQRYCFEHVIRDDESIQRQVAYILQNPVRKGLVTNPLEYPFIGSGIYTTPELVEFAFWGECHNHDRRSG